MFQSQNFIETTITKSLLSMCNGRSKFIEKSGFFSMYLILI